MRDCAHDGGAKSAIDRAKVEMTASTLERPVSMSMRELLV
jgi:hypothetical protein